jgi:hypothetical protein
MPFVVIVFPPSETPYAHVLPPNGRCSVAVSCSEYTGTPVFRGKGKRYSTEQKPVIRYVMDIDGMYYLQPDLSRG